MTVVRAVILAVFAAASPVASPTLAAPGVGVVAESVDRLIVEGVGLSPGELAPPVGDAAFLRRAHLDVLGTIPSADEVRDFVADDDENKRKKLVRKLVDRPEFGLNLARYWRDVILSRRLEDRALLVAPALVEDLAAWINEGRGWDEIAQDFITATGPVNENGATAIVMAQGGRTEEIAAEVSRVFLGIQIQCAQCHDHPWDDWKREQFHELAAFFPRVGAKQIRGARPPEFEVVVNNRPDKPRFRKPQVAARQGSPEHYMQDLERPDLPGERIEPRFFLTSLAKPAGTPDAERRGELAAELTETDWFATALVNRVWSELVGEGFYEPVDDLGPGRDASAPRAADRLAAAFAANGYDLKWLYRTVMATDAYQRESRPRRTPDGKPFAASVAQPLRGDQMFDALLASLDVDEKLLRGFTAGQRPGGRRPTPRMLVAATFGYDPSDPRETINATIPQALVRMNGPQLNRAVRAGKRSMLSRVLNETDGDEQAVDELYLRTLSRLPTDDERATALEHVDGSNTRGVGFEDLLWALLNSAEFSHRR